MARIDHYEFGRIVVDGCEETRDLIILPDRVVRNWLRQQGHALVVDDLRGSGRTRTAVGSMGGRGELWSWRESHRLGCLIASATVPT
jgi:hypothetical protein